MKPQLPETIAYVAKCALIAADSPRINLYKAFCAVMHFR